MLDSTSGETWLPMNRKERYFTGTVLPMIVCSDNFSNFGKFLALIDTTYDAAEWESNQIIQFFTECNLRESIFTPEDRNRFANNVPETGHTPDVMILFRRRHRRLLVVIEAKMFDNVTLREMGEQLKLQRQNVLSKLIEPLQLTWDDIIQVALIPTAFVANRQSDKWHDSLGEQVRVVTWEQLISTYKNACKETYFIGILKKALASFADLRGRPTGNADALLTGRNIFDEVYNSSCKYTTMGRQSGWRQALQDVIRDDWSWREYQVRRSGTPNKNWFPISDLSMKLER